MTALETAEQLEQFLDHIEEAIQRLAQAKRDLTSAWCNLKGDQITLAQVHAGIEQQIGYLIESTITIKYGELKRYMEGIR